MGVRAKFRCDVKLDMGRIVLHAVAGGSKENDEFFQATPNGTIDLSIVNPAAITQFEIGKSYFVDFTLVK